MLSSIANISGDGVDLTLGTGVGVGYLSLVLSASPRVRNHAMSTPEAPSTRTMAKTQGRVDLRDADVSALTCCGAF
jgi:hypothetical protein